MPMSSLQSLLLRKEMKMDKIRSDVASIFLYTYTFINACTYILRIESMEDYVVTKKFSIPARTTTSIIELIHRLSILIMHVQSVRMHQIQIQF